MRRILMTCFFVFITHLIQVKSITAFDISQKWGKVTMEEMEMPVYPPDTSAKAVILYQKQYTNFDYQAKNGFNDYTNIGFKVNSFFSQKIKILKPVGREVGTIKIPYFNYSKNNESVTDMEALIYNLVDGKIVKKRLDKKYILDEVYNKFFHIITLSMPGVNVGSVIEFRYQISSKNDTYIPDWNIQHDLPVMISDFQVDIPEFYDFYTSVKGFESLKIKETSESASYEIINTNYEADRLSCTLKIISCNAHDIPALKEPSNVWCMNDYYSGVQFDLRGTRYPNKPYIPFSNAWETLENVINDDTEFAMKLQMSNPWKSETAKLIANVTDEQEKISILYDFIKKRIRWNDHYDLFNGFPKEAIKNGTGNNAEINFVLMSVLRDAGIKTYPILLSERSKGQLPLTNATIDQLSTFIVAAMTKDSSFYYMDGSAKYGGPNMLPTDLQVDRARVFNKSSVEKWVDLTKLTPNFQISNIQAELTKDGLLKGVRSTSYTNQFAYDYKSNFASTKDSMEFIKNLQKRFDLTVDSMEVTGKEPMSNSVNERMVFNKQMNTVGDFMYVNAMIFRHLSNNPFTQTDRKLPIEFTYPYGYQSTCTLQIPDGYQVEELPKSVKFKLPGKVGECQFVVRQSGNTVTFNYLFQLYQIVFAQTDYPMIQDFFGQAAAKNVEMLVLKKKVQ
ncbi:MAG TPA: DUF3857 domain-containing protein [Bacteroidales bacterium]|nr:DUF3857 domain-containing protein [Bacteroidales bacterium]